MPTFMRGNIWGEVGKADLILVTTNAVVTQSGSLVMGAGAAGEAQVRFPELPRDLGAKIRAWNAELGPGNLRSNYGVVISDVVDQGTRLGAFQAKFHFAGDSSLGLIAHSAAILGGLASKYKRIALNYPGIGYGRMKKADVEPVLLPLPAHVFIYEGY